MFTRKKTPIPFKARSTQRDAATDTMRFKTVDGALHQIIVEARVEREGLAHRLADVVTRASMTVGNNTDEYRERDPARDAQQSSFSADIKYAERRLQELARQLELFQALKLRLAESVV